MIGETYELHDHPSKHRFSFFSEGPKGLIQKSVIYTHVEDKLYNLGFGDAGKGGNIDDSVISNNKDLVKIMNTVAETIYIFTDDFPEKQIYIQPVDAKRSKLYHAIFNRKWDEISVNFKVEGMIRKNVWEGFNLDENYLAFKLTKKNKKDIK